MATTASAPLLDQNVSKFVSRTHKILINGKWVDAASGKTFPTYNPATGDILSRVAEGDKEDINRAVKSARAAFETGPWSKLTPSERGRMVWKLGDLIEKPNAPKTTSTARARRIRMAFLFTTYSSIQLKLYILRSSPRQVTSATVRW